jgi:hypothetical protein
MLEFIILAVLIAAVEEGIKDNKGLKAWVHEMKNIEE